MQRHTSTWVEEIRRKKVLNETRKKKFLDNFWPFLSKRKRTERN